MSVQILSILLAASLLTAGCKRDEPEKIGGMGGLTAKMTDQEVMQMMKLIPDKMHISKAEGPDGYSTTYSDDRYEVTITHSTFSGLTVICHTKATDTFQMWKPREP